MELAAYFRSALGVVLQSLVHADADEVNLWSGGEQPAPPSEARETALDGDAFHANEQIIVNERCGHQCFVLGLHVFSDASQVSWSGGTRVCLVGWSYSGTLFSSFNFRAVHCCSCPDRPNLGEQQ